VSRQRLEDRFATVEIDQQERREVKVRWEVLGPSDNPERHPAPMEVVISRWDDDADRDDEWYIDPDLICEMADAIRFHREEGEGKSE
jgi:hypothetical protein